MGVPIARCELLDAHAIRAVNRHDKLTLREAPMLLMEFHGSAASVAEQARRCRRSPATTAAPTSSGRRTPEERTRLWTARHNAYFAGAADRGPAAARVTTDTCVPISRLAECIDESVAEAEASGLPYCIVGHVGDGNFHLGYLIDPDDPAERERPSG